jgi:hypothetical protein
VTLFADMWSESVQRSGELGRVVALPRRAPDLPVVDQTERFRVDGGEQVLRPVQSLALCELTLRRGLFAPMRVGAGKTLVSFLAASAVHAERPVLVIPAKLRSKTMRELGELRRHWKVEPLQVVSYELLGREQHAGWLESVRPDLLVFDECHKVRNKRAAVTRRVRRYVEAHPDTVVVAMSGTITRRSLLDYAHLLRWCLGDEHAPVPRELWELETWAAALDEQRDPMSRRVAPGALLVLRGPEEDGLSPRDAARSAFRRRLTETSGVVATRGEPGCVASIALTSLLPPESAPIEQAFDRLRSAWEAPDGQPLADGFAVDRVARQIGMGFYYAWDPPAPPAWLEARRVWCAYVRSVLRRSRSLDTELQVRRQHAETPECRAWLAVRDDFEPTVVARWLCDSVVQRAAELLREPGICWVEHVQMGEAVAALADVPLYGAGGLDVPPTGRPVVMTVQSGSEGRNLQAWSRNIVLSPPASGSVWEQLVGRTHREGQQADEVTLEVAGFCREHVQSWWKSVADARYVEQTTGAVQKLLMVDHDVMSLEELGEMRGARW